ncbi:MAG: NADH-quinone oxidoreductase subunit I [Akkermansiaceae bacterium]|mgnify:CR=1 FL=1|jgi:NADH-quinone oxidoreductase subunit I|tara:strand:- start:3897 stop:4622 length:726 start_codon:yes stop_codon:yes gene_type:complete
MESPANTDKTTASKQPAKQKWILPGAGLYQGLVVTAKNFIQSYYKKERLTTVQYPEERAPISPNFRNFPFLVHDGDDADVGLRCTACTICEKSCPPQCIYIVLDRDENGKSKKRPKVFDIDLSVCMNCGICAEVCPFDSIYMDNEFELSKDDRFGGMLYGLDRLVKSTEFHAKIRPEEAAQVAASRKAAAEKKAAAAIVKAERLKKKAEDDRLKKEEEKEAAQAAETPESPEDDTTKGDSE